MNCVAAPDTRMIGHNNPPRPEPFGLRAAWLRFANAVELRRLARLHVRVKLKERALKEVISERQRIMNRCIRRMRRSEGKN